MKNKLWFIALAVFALLIVCLRLFAARPDWVEAYYSRGFYYYLCNLVTLIFSSIPFSLFELLVIMALASVIFLLIKWIRMWRQKRATFSRATLSLLLRYTTLAAAVYAWFLICWGLNYYRVPLDQKAGFENARADEEQMRMAAHWACGRIESLFSEELRADVVEATAQSLDALDRVLENAGEEAPGRGNVLKRFFWNYPLDASGTTGITSPFTLEVHLNKSLFPEEIPFVAAHETAHLKGYTSEAEANLLAFEACLESGHPLAQFSAFFHVYGYLSRPLPKEERKALFTGWPEGVKDLLKRIDERNREHEGLLLDACRSVYDLYLNFNAVPGGIQSYSRVGNWVAVLHQQEAMEAREEGIIAAPGDKDESSTD